MRREGAEIFTNLLQESVVDGRAGSSGLRKGAGACKMEGIKIGGRRNDEGQRDMSRVPRAIQTLPQPSAFLKKRKRG